MFASLGPWGIQSSGEIPNRLRGEWSAGGFLAGLLTMVDLATKGQRNLEEV